MRTIRQNFLSVLDRLKETQNIVMIDANKELDMVAKEVMKHV